MPSRRLGGLLAVVALVVLAAAVPPVHGSTAPLPPSTWGGFLSGLNFPTLAPGASGPVGFSVGDPLGVPMTSVVFTLGVYEFNAYPGNATGPVPAGGAPVFSGSGAGSSSSITISVGTLADGAATYASPGAVDLFVAAPAGAPQGTYAVRTSLTFEANGTAYVLESRGFFSSAAWANATSPPDHVSTLNATRLGVSGVVPESAVLVRSNPYPVTLAVILGGAVVLAAVGGYWAVRRRPGSRSGASAGPPPSHADTAFGKSRTSDGD
ncbi:MAG: hypothetical protein L3K16_04610 [Thermoplasmata archaeon]|nr:hypothetical protein [Thermoplasmata archaeon]